MKKKILTLSFLIATINSTAQIAAVDTDDGSSSKEVTDIVIVFKMHFDIGYTTWAEGVLQQYSSEMLEETLESIEKTSHLPESEQCYQICTQRGLQPL